MYIKKQMKIRTILTTFFLAVTAFTAVVAQPSAVKNSSRSAFLLTAYNANGGVVATSYGVFTSSDGEAVGAWSALANAARAEVTDLNGKTYPVTKLIGANELYDVCRFKVGVNKVQPAVLATSPLQKDAKAWLVRSEAKKTIADEFEVEREETFMDKYAYYVFAYNPKTGVSGCPFVNASGQVVGLYQASSSSLGSNAVDARFAAQLTSNPMAVSNVMFAKTGLRLQLPADHKDALLMVMLAAEMRDTAKYEGYVNDYLEAFPHEVDGYATRAMNKVGRGDYAGADADMKTALRQATNKAEAHAEYSRVMYQKMLYSADTLFTAWTLDKALEESEKAYSMDPQPGYRHRTAQILFSKGEYAKAYDMFKELASTTMRTGEVYFEAAQCKTQLGASKDEVVVLLDSAVAACNHPLDATAAPYVLARGQMNAELGQYKKAIADYNVYDTLMYGRANAEFYFARYQCEVKVRQYQQALNDIAHAAYIGGQNTPFYLAEMASLQLRVNMLEDAVKSSDLCLSLSPENTDALIIKGVALVNLKKKDEGMECFRKASELGDKRGDEYKEKYK